MNSRLITHVEKMEARVRSFKLDFDTFLNNIYKLAMIAKSDNDTKTFRYLLQCHSEYAKEGL